MAIRFRHSYGEFHIVANARRAGAKSNRSAVDAIETLDLFAQIRDDTGRWYKLDAIAAANLDQRKTADGLQAVAWLRAGDPESVAKAMAYCKADVQIVVDLVAKMERVNHCVYRRCQSAGSMMR